ncbi:hypothetical protein ZEAMMB73_Zm00001d034529 [Zea mays]|uniref:Uncharacterized protein n=1 Tax=Zea mays TaxID=4577 RepID=A0A1D6L8E6_MAIZE|nr:hypothetical protein ZEAMMB73_Zm00001d034529 [Zea mays]
MARRRRGSAWRATRRRSRLTASSRSSAARHSTSSRASPPSSASPSSPGPHTPRSASTAAASSSSAPRSLRRTLSLTPPRLPLLRRMRKRTTTMGTASTNTSIEVCRPKRKNGDNFLRTYLFMCFCYKVLGHTFVGAQCDPDILCVSNWS